MARKLSQIKAPDHTQQEARYLQRLVDERIPVRVRMSDNQEVEGLVEFYDATFIRLTRDGEPNLFLYKQDLKYLYELAQS
ncbi:MAG: Sm ribonucleo-like protein [Acidobacteriota bacterium]|nr:Sm ribonucleo-like protein [Acidobacteriota bacterium]